MSIIKTETNVPTLKINYLTQEMYDDALENDQINDNELYLTPNAGGDMGTSVPTANMSANFDEDAHINSKDMSAQDVSDFVDGLDGQGSGITFHRVMHTGTTGVTGVLNIPTSVFNPLNAYLLNVVCTDAGYYAEGRGYYNGELNVRIVRYDGENCTSSSATVEVSYIE